MDTEQSETKSPSAVADLTGPRMPKDHGLASLGLIMQLGGSMFVGVMAFMAIFPLFLGASTQSWTIFVVGATGAVRSAFHRAAGTALIYGSPSGPFRAIRTYIAMAAVQTVLWVLVLNDAMTGKDLAALVILLLSWPVALGAILASPRMRALADSGIPMSEDRGFEGTSVLMLLLGVIGTLFAGAMLLAVFKLPGQALSSPHALLFMAVLVVLLIRSVMHATAGYHGTRGADADFASRSAERYYSFGVVSSIIAGAALLIELMMTAFHPMVLLLVGMVVYLLLVWPLALRRYYTERNFSVLLAGEDAPIFRRAPDAGMTALGWLLLALGVMGIASSLPAALLGPTMGTEEIFGLGSSLFGSDLSAFGRSQWWGVGIAALQLWAAYELITMSDRFQIATTIYGAVAALVSAYLYWPLLDMFKEMDMGGFGFGMNGFGSQLIVGQLAIALVVPIGSIVLAQRKLTPDAQARIRNAQ